MTSPRIAKGLIAGATARLDDSASDLSRAGRSGRRRLIAFAALGIAAYAGSMVARLPASVLVGDGAWATGVSGTVWRGEVGVTGGNRVEWRWAPLRSLTSLAFAVDWRATGPDTDLGGRALLRGERVVLDAVSGSANGGLLAAAAPDLPFACALVMQVELPRVAVGGGERLVEGNVTSDAGTCAAKGGGVASAVPALHMAAEHVGAVSRLRLTPATHRRRTLIDAALSEAGALDVRMTPEGAAALPFVGVPGGVSVGLRL